MSTLHRARIFFLLFLLVFFFITGTAVYAGWQSGELQRIVITPLKQAAGNLYQMYRESVKLSEDFRTPPAASPESSAATPSSQNQLNFQVAPQATDAAGNVISPNQ